MTDIGPAPRVLQVDDPAVLQALSHPTRVAILDRLRDPASAASVAREIGQPRQRINYHLKELEQAGLVEQVGEERAGNFVASLYRSVARAFVVSPKVAWSDPRRMEALRSQHSLETLVALGERMTKDSAELLDRAAFDGEEISSASVSAEVFFASEQERSAFMDEYLESLRSLVEKYAAPDGRGNGSERVCYNAVFAIYPKGE